MESEERGKVVRLSRKEKERRILELWRSGHSYKEICSALRVSSKTVAKVLRKAEEGEGIERLIEAKREELRRLIKEVFREFWNERIGERLELIFTSIDGRLKVVEARSYDLEKWREKVNDAIKDVHSGRLDELEGRLKELEAFSYRLAKDLPLLIHEVCFIADLLKDYFFYTIAFVKDLKRFEDWLEKWREDRDRKAKEKAKLARCLYG